MSRRRRRASAQRCLSCGRPIVLLISPFSGKWRTFEPAPIESGRQLPDIFPVENRRAWRPRELIEDLMVRRRASYAEAEREVYDMPWYQIHRCPIRDDESRSPDAAPAP